MHQTSWVCLRINTSRNKHILYCFDFLLLLLLLISGRLSTEVHCCLPLIKNNNAFDLCKWKRCLCLFEQRSDHMWTHILMPGVNCSTSSCPLVIGSPMHANARCGQDYRGYKVQRIKAHCENVNMVSSNLTKTSVSSNNYFSLKTSFQNVPPFSEI